MKIRPMGAVFNADGRPDMKLTVAFRNFVKTPKNYGKIRKYSK